MADPMKHYYKLPDLEAIEDKEYQDRPSVLSYNGKYYNIRETKTTGDNEQTHFYYECSFKSLDYLLNSR